VIDPARPLEVTLNWCVLVSVLSKSNATALKILLKFFGRNLATLTPAPLAAIPFPATRLKSARQQRPAESRRGMSQPNAAFSLANFGFANPYPCMNPAAQCERVPSATKLNQILGCMQIDSDGGCTLQQCPTFMCGNHCPTPCVLDADDAACQTFLNNQYNYYDGTTGSHDCSDFYEQMLLRLIHQTPIEGCTEACAGTKAAGKNLCCSNASIDRARLPQEPPLQLNGSSYADVDPILTYENYLNGWLICLTQTCACP